MSQKILSVRQADSSDCGVAAVVSVTGAFGLRLSIANTRLALNTSKQGTTALSLIRGLQSLGFTAKAVKGPVDALPTVPFPAIAHCRLESGLMHYVVLVKWNVKYATVMDPAVGRVEKWPRDKFKAVWTGVLILVAPGDNFKPGDRTTSPWRCLWGLLQPNKALLTQAFFGVLASTILGLGMSIFVQKIIDDVIPDANRQLLNLLGVAMLFILAFRLLLGVFQSLLSMRLAQRIDAALITAYYKRLMRLPQQFFDSMRVGEITSRVGDAVKIRNFLNATLLNLMLNPLIVIFALTVMFWYSWKLALFSLVLVPCNGVIYWAVNWFNRVYQRRIMERSADFDAQLVESLNAQQTVRRFGLEEYSELRTETRLVQLLRTVWRMALGAIGSGTASTLVTQAYMIVLLWIGGRLVLDAVLTPGELMSCYTLANYLTGPIASLIGMNASIQDALVATDRLFDIMDLELEKDQGAIALDNEHAGNGVRFEKITFSHAGRAGTLQDVSFEAPRGRITVLMGESGCGKSTILSLLQRLYTPSGGRIFVGEHDIQYYSLASLRRAMSVVPQQTVLLSGTVVENIVPGDFEPDMERILKVCREVGVLETIEKLPQGFLTFLNENGANLSGGQRQRLALARALYRDAPILLLDEPSSALDGQSEQMLMEVLRKLRDAGKVIILAAHSPALLGVADQIVTMSSGKVMSVGGQAE
jgi:ATP-binding cassette subfamily B protein